MVSPYVIRVPCVRRSSVILPPNTRRESQKTSGVSLHPPLLSHTFTHYIRSVWSLRSADVRSEVTHAPFTLFPFTLHSCVERE